MQNSSAILRPGIALGLYPQREDERDNWLDRLAASINGYIRQRAYGRYPGHEGFLALVNQQSDGLKDRGDDELRFLIPDLRRHLYSEGLREELVARVFAIAREMAKRRLGICPYDVQLIGGKVMLEGKIAEMETGEGKTLTAMLSACAAALSGIPVHIVTVNDFLVMRDAAWMRPVYKAFGLAVGTVTEGMSPEARRQAYSCDITYCTNKQLAFDYLKDRLMLGQESRRLHLQIEGLHAEFPRTSLLLLRGLCFVIADEADSVLIDEARTPLIISDMPDTSHEEHIYTEAITMARKLDLGLDFSIKPRDREVQLTDRGRFRAAELAEIYGGIWIGARRREELIKRSLTALHMFHFDKHYLVRDGRVQIVDEYTGRVMPDRSWERGLHQMIEAKEGCHISGQQETLARISYQRFFRRYLMLAGMTGTAREVARELWAVYRVPVVTIPTNRPIRRQQFPDTVCVNSEVKWRAIVDTVDRLHKSGRPVLVGTRSVAASEHLSKLLTNAGLHHQVLNARQDMEEAEIIAKAGERGRIMVATNMAGRGTDIRIREDVVKLGGLHVLATERHDSRRIDRQLFGRGGRQGDPGSYQAIVSLEDELVKDVLGDKVVGLLQRMLGKRQFMPGIPGKILLLIAQQLSERHHASIRRNLLRVDDYLSDLLAFTGRPE